jgi:hypothetical protein
MRKSNKTETGKEVQAVGKCEWLDWHSCYDEGWKGLIVDEAFAHP